MMSQSSGMFSGKERGRTPWPSFGIPGTPYQSDLPEIGYYLPRGIRD